MEDGYVPLMLLWISYLYMPVAVAVYLYHRERPSIKHRLPIGTASAGLFASIYCLAQPLCAYFSESTSCGITEIIAQPTNVSHDRVAVWNYFRGMIIPSIQVPVGICVCVLWNFPHILLLALHATTISQLSYAECITMDFFNLIMCISIGQAAVLLVGCLFIGHQLRHTTDTYHVRWSYVYTSMYMVACSSLCLVYWLVSTYSSALTGFHVIEVMTTQGLQGIVFFNILLPLVSAYKDRHKVKDLTGSTSLQVNWDSYLQSNEAYLSYMEFCHGHTAILLAWKASVDFRNGDGKLNVFEVYQMHIAPDGAFTVYDDLPDLLRRKYTKKIHRLRQKASLVMTNVSKVVPMPEIVDADFYEPLRRELVLIMVTSSLALYEKDELGKDWLSFHTRRRSIHSLEYVQKVASKVDVLRESVAVKQPKAEPLWGSVLHSKSSDTQLVKDEIVNAPEVRLRDVIHVRPSIKATPSDARKSHGNNAKLVPGDVDDLSDDEADDLTALDGAFLWIFIDVHVDPSTSSQLLTNSSKYRVSYTFFQSNAQLFPLEHTHVLKVLVTPPFVDYVSADMMSFDVVPHVDSLDTTAPCKDDSMSHTALLEEIQRDKAKLAQQHEAEKQRNDQLCGELSKLIDHVKDQEGAMLQQVKTGQSATTEVVRLQEKARADAREKELLLKQVTDADSKYQTLLDNANNKSKACLIQ
ncbi:hypothetical protein DYB37_001543 [Aphanomyces astaci]|uniref:RGS domain-containing protein n=1 Tax=Aphanomyces astaci TaxID=112090 RepID=A0A3R7AX79_APHAT|nr:hypothetical protein DYB37_001543 [Aphanomyces astaci]